MDDIELKRKFSVDRDWFKWVDPRPSELRNEDPAQPSRTVQDLWTYGPDEDLELRFETAPERGFAIHFRGERVGFSPDLNPEPVPGASINCAKRDAVRICERLKDTKR